MLEKFEAVLVEATFAHDVIFPFCWKPLEDTKENSGDKKGKKKKKKKKKKKNQKEKRLTKEKK